MCKFYGIKFFLLLFIAQHLTAKHHEVEASNLSLRDEIKELTAKGWVVS